MVLEEYMLENTTIKFYDDELVEITPKNIRLRKKILDTAERKKFDSKRLALRKGN